MSAPVVVCHVASDGTEHWDLRPDLATAKTIVNGTVAHGETGYVYELRKKWSYVYSPVVAAARTETGPGASQ